MRSSVSTNASNACSGKSAATEPVIPMRLLRLLKILRVSLRYGLDEFFLGHERVRGLRPLLSAVLFWRRLERPRGERLRLALEALGPIFVKFGQVLSTRRDLVPARHRRRTGETAGPGAAVSGGTGVSHPRTYLSLAG